MNRRPPRKFALDPPPAPVATINPADLPIDPPGWVQSISHALDCQGASQGLAGAIARYFAATEWEGLGDPTVICWPHAVVMVEFRDYSDARCRFLFRGRLDVSMIFMPRCGLVVEIFPQPLGQAIEEGRRLPWQLWRTGLCGKASLPGDFDAAGVNDALPVNRPVKVKYSKGTR